jgi:hypothetical protein
LIDDALAPGAKLAHTRVLAGMPPGTPAARQSVRLSAFDGETWKLFGDVLSNEST